MFSATKPAASTLETGRVGASPRDIRDLCIVYGITDQGERDRLMDLAREGKQRAWWQQFDLPYATYVGLEAEAASISLYDTDLVPGLLQVEPYARAIFESGDPPLEPAAIRQRIEAKAAQAVEARWATKARRSTASSTRARCAAPSAAPLPCEPSWPG